jgi:hypothetical protein
MDRPWARTATIAGFVAVASYVALIFLSVPTPLQVALTFGFGFGLTLASIGLYYAVARPASPRLALVAVVANTLGAAQLIGMILVQMAVKETEPDPSAAFTAIWLGLDVAWDLYIGAGTVAFALCMLRHPNFRPILGGLGLIVGLLLLVLNVATFPTPPGVAGLFDAGPFVGVWYLLVSVQVHRLSFRPSERRREDDV